jgi:farnesyl diphosphate synthase
MVGGQMIDLASEGAALDIGGVTRLQQMKTGALIAVSCEAGAILGRASPAHRAALHAFAHDLGLAFQIADDLLDHEGDEAKAGKGLRKDAEAGKATFVSLMGVDKARDQAEALAEQAVGHLASHGDEADTLRALARFIVERDR